MSDWVAVAHNVNAAMAERRVPEALNMARDVLQLMWAAPPLGLPIDVDLIPLSHMQFATRRSHIELTFENGIRTVRVPLEILDRSFTNWTDAFYAIGVICSNPPLCVARSGSCIFDIEDGSPGDDYDRVAFCATSSRACLVTDSYFIKYGGYEKLRADISASWIPWQQRSDSVFWRGSTTGLRKFTPSPDSGNRLDYLQRLELCVLASNSKLSSKLDVGISRVVQIDEPYLRDAIACANIMKPSKDKLEFLKYRYLIDVDGNANAWDGLFSAMLMGACILKIDSPVGWSQWYYNKLEPWVHYLPVRSDLADLEEVCEWAFSNPSRCEAIGASARQLALALEFTSEVSGSSERILKLVG